ncbi:hypothetical protein QAD02_005828 [Eretmocerus hayati]|uniref:Uncharacterized protein n=1 Tax=Eretmocerus hayati TaxID=131215 RepID=A0ACC2NUR0_9HYME|nr:hypothetical protein QAD02_005828 [Eretmocerus hayati]
MFFQSSSLIGVILIILETGAVYYNGSHYPIGRILRELEEDWRQTVEILGLASAKIPDRNLTIVTGIIEWYTILRNGNLYGGENAIIRPQDEVYLITQDPLLILGNMTWPKLTAEYEYSTSVHSGTVEVVLKDVTCNFTLSLRPESKTEPIDINAKAITWGDVKINFTGSNMDWLMQFFEQSVLDIVPPIVREISAIWAVEFAKRFNKNFPQLAKTALAGLIQKIDGPSELTT